MDGGAAARVARGLGLGDEHAGWLAELEQVGTPPATALPGAREAAELLTRLGCSRDSIADTVATLPHPARDPERWWLLERCHARLVRDIGNPDVGRGSWPKLPESLGLEGSCFYLHLYLATLPAALSWHREHLVPEDVSWATLADLGRHVEIHRAATGTTGVDEPWWMTLHLRCILFELGRLQYTAFRLGIGPEHPAPWYDDATAGELGEGFRPGDPALGIHIPAGSPLAPAACEESMRRARDFFDAVLPVGTRRLATCSSWLLDDQLAGLLSPGSNIVAFQRSFVLVPGWGDGAGAMTFVFRHASGPLEHLPARTSLQRAVLAHLQEGGRLRWRTGWRDLPGGR